MKSMFRALVALSLAAAGAASAEPNVIAYTVQLTRVVDLTTGVSSTSSDVLNASFVFDLDAAANVEYLPDRVTAAGGYGLHSPTRPAPFISHYDAGPLSHTASADFDEMGTIMRWRDELASNVGINASSIRDTFYSMGVTRESIEASIYLRAADGVLFSDINDFMDLAIGPTEANQFYAVTTTLACPLGCPPASRGYQLYGYVTSISVLPAVPEPGTWMLAGLGLVGVWLAAARRRC